MNKVLKFKKTDWQTQLEAHVAQMNKTHASVMIGGKHRIMRLKDGSATHDGRCIFELIARRDLELLYDHTRIKVGEKVVSGKTLDVFANHIKAWAEHPEAQTFTGGVVFLPGRIAPADYFNTWQGFSVEPMQNDALLEPIYYHMKEVVCAGHQELYDYLLKWIAFTVQNPDKPAGSAIVLRGEKGSGKGTIGHFLNTLWGNHGLHISNAKHLVGNFNGHLANVCFLFADEAFYSGDKQHEGVLKALITEPVLTVERKFIDAVPMPNYLKILMATNADYAVPASRDERRYCVMDVSSDRIGDREYFNVLHAACSSPDVQAAFLFAMQHVDLTGFHTGDIPDSKGLRAQRIHSFKPHQKWLMDSLRRETFAVCGYSGNAEIWDDELTIEELFKSYLTWCDLQKIDQYGRVTLCVLSQYLKKIYKAKKHPAGFRGRRGYTLGSIDKAIELFERHERVSITELADNNPVQND